MSVALDREKDLPLIPVDDIATIDVDGERRPIPSSKSVTFSDADKAPPPIQVESRLSEEEMSRLHELWNGAALSARAHRRRATTRRIPTPISIPELESVPLSLPSAGPSTASTGRHKRWGFRSARSLSERPDETKAPSALGRLRTMAQDRLKKKLRYAKSTPNLNDQSVSSGRSAHKRVETARDREASSTRDAVSPATPETAVQKEDVQVDENAIYFTIDPTWRASRGSVEFESITPIRESVTPSGRPDSPLLHRNYSLDQLSFAEQKVAAVESGEMDARDEVLELIDELHVCLKL